MTTEYTEHFRLNLPDFRMGPWHDLVNDDFVMVDTLLWNLFQGVDTVYWENGQNYTKGITAIDPADQSFWICMVDHVSAASGTFAADRAAHPTYWNRVVTGIAPRGEWAHSTNYLPADLVCDSHEHIIAVCKTAHTSNASGTIRDDAANWTYLVDMGAITTDAINVGYDGSTSGSPASDVQGAIDHLYSRDDTQQVMIDANTTEIGVHSTQLTAQSAAISSNTTRISSLETLTGSFIVDAPADGQLYGRKDHAWYVVTGGGGGGGSPGGANGNIQYNNGGNFGGLTDIQVTARIQPFTNAASGAVPASGGGTTKFLRADGTFEVPNYPIVSYPVTSVFGRFGAVVAQANDYTFAQIGSKPTTLAGYGITDAQPALGYTPVNKAGDTMTGTLTMAPVAANANYVMSKPAGAYANQIVGYTVSSVRWVVLPGDSVAEGGSNVGSNFQIQRYNDAGALLGVPFSIDRATGNTTIAGVLTADRSTVGAASLILNGQDAASGGSLIRARKNGTEKWLEGTVSAIAGNTSDDWGLYSIGLGGYPYIINYVTGNITFYSQTIFEGQASSPLQALTASAGITWDANLGQKAKIVLGASNGLNPVSNAVEGATYFLWLIQDGTGGRTINFTVAGANSFDFGAAGAPTLSTAANKADLLTFEAISIAGTLKLRYTGIAKGFG